MHHALHHAVQFYGNDASLITTVGGFLSEGLIAGQPSILIATAEHSTAILEELRSRMIDVESARKGGDLIVLDAAETLALFMTEDMPDAEAFETSMARFIDQMQRVRPNTVIRAYGEMVDLLWKAQRPEAAIRLEVLWNKLAATYHFALLCGYSMGNFYKQAALFEEVCRQHTHIINPGKNVVVMKPKRSRSA